MTRLQERAAAGPRRQWYSLRTRLLLWTVGVTGVLLASVIAWNYLSVRERLETEAQARARFLAEGSADRIDARLGPLQGLVQGIALTLEAESLAVPFEQVRGLLENALRTHPELYGVAIALLPARKPGAWPNAAPYLYRDGQVLRDEDLDAGEHRHIAEDWFALPRYLDLGVWSEPYVWKTGVRMVTYSTPIRVATPDGRVFAGVVTCDIDLGWLDGILAELPLGEEGYGLLMTRRGTYVSHPLQDLVFNESVFSIAEARGQESLRELGQAMISGRPGLLPWVSWTTGAETWLAWQPLNTVDWTIGTVISQAELRAGIFRLTRSNALVGGLGLGLLVLAVWLVASSITRPVVALSGAAATLAAGDLDAPLPVPRGADEVAQLTGAFAVMRDSLKRYIAELAASTAARERLNSELRIAHDIQMDLVPKTFPAFPERPDLDLFALMVPARQVGGDFYDFFFLDATRLVIAIGDVSGKGIPAALFMAVTRSFFRSEFRTDPDPGRALGRVNGDLSEGNESCMFVTLFCAVVNLSDGTVQYANAGHNLPLVARGSGRVEWVDRPRGPAAAILPGSTYETGNLTLAAGESLLLYTDGVTEAMDPANRLYGEPRLEASLQAFVSGSCRSCLDALLGDVRAHAAGAEQSDDITLLMIRWIGQGAIPPATGADAS